MDCGKDDIVCFGLILIRLLKTRFFLVGNFGAEFAVLFRTGLAGVCLVEDVRGALSN